MEYCKTVMRNGLISIWMDGGFNMTLLYDAVSHFRHLCTSIHKQTDSEHTHTIIESKNAREMGKLIINKRTNVQMAIVYYIKYQAKWESEEMEGEGDRKSSFCICAIIRWFWFVLEHFNVIAYDNYWPPYIELQLYNNSDRFNNTRAHCDQKTRATTTTVLMMMIITTKLLRKCIYAIGNLIAMFHSCIGMRLT